MTDLRESLLELLSQVERREMETLNWGAVDAAFTSSELETTILDFLEGDTHLATLTASEILDELIDRHLIFRLPRGDGARFRSRMAETARLLARLRQIFRGQQWRVGRPLVADYRLVIRSRQRPIREIGIEDVVGRLQNTMGLSAVREALLRSALSGPSGAMELARFQLRATEHVLRSLDGGNSTGLVVASTTGSGKTLAFYLPALIHIGELIGPNDDHWTKALAVYPRNELLKDQLRSAIRSARALDATQARRRRRQIRLGAWFSLTPYTPRHIPNSWPTTSQGAVCPYLVCLACSGPLVWLTRDSRDGVERLTCSRCSEVVGEDELVLSRSAMRAKPPDLLFTTTESLNRQLASPFNAPIFGVGAQQRPRLCLLDEIHTYDGVHGAHVALLLRRWRRAVASPIVFVGLSATLADAQTFMADLTGLADHQIAVIEPAGEQLEHYGMEYLIALRHDPGSQTSPLSTTIQTSMLLARMLDPRGGGASGGAFGERLFAFTDRLDSVNRLYWDLLDAEGWFRPGAPIRWYTPRALATLRAPDPNEDPFEAEARRNAGQCWDFAQQLGHRLVDDRQLGVGRTTSQDTGVEAQAEVIAATASLEVGFDDERVGTVIQHKAPHDAARFLQRKGRAGRRPDGRPWTAVVLSDFGRDRVAYQSYDQLFAPTLEPRRLPTGNRYVLRMQAIYALVDWVCQGVGLGGGWRELAGPATPGSADEYRQHRAARLLREALEEPTRQKNLVDHLQRSLRLTAEDLHAVLWEAPRPLLTGAVPTLLRRLETGWSDGSTPGGESHGSTPLPEYAPGSLFSDLLVPEVGINIPGPQHGGQPVVDSLGVEQAIRELCPGNVTRRYAIADRSERHWAPLPDARTVDLEQLPNYRWLAQGRVEWRDDGLLRVASCLRPIEIQLEQTPSGVTDGWKASPRWRSSVVALGPGRPLPVGEPSTWRSVLSEVRAVLHRDDTAARITRFVPELEVTTRVGGAVTIRRVPMAAGPEAEPAAVGFVYEGDAIQLLVRLPSAAEGELSEEILAESRAAYFYEQFENGDEFPPQVSVFHRHWLRVALLIAVIRERGATERGLGPAVSRLLQSGLGNAMGNACAALFRAVDNDDVNDGRDEVEEEAPVAQRGALHDVLVHLCGDAGVIRAIEQLAHILYRDPDEAWMAWEGKRLASTVGASFVEAAADLCGEIDTDDLVVDVLETDGQRELAVWITEASPGGAGIVERIVEDWIADPGRFLRVMRRRLGPSDFEALDADLTTVATWLRADADLQDTFADARSSWGAGHDAAAEGVRRIRSALAERGLVVGRQLLVALNTRVLAPGTGPLFDELLADFLDSWTRTEAMAGVALDSRVMAAVFAEDDRIDAALHLDLSIPHPTPGDRYAALLAISWPRGADLRSVAMAAPNRYSSLPPTTKRRLLGLLDADTPTVPVHEGEAIRERLADDGSVIVGAEAGEEMELRRQLLGLATNPVDCGFLLSFARITSAERTIGQLSLRLELPESQG